MRRPTRAAIAFTWLALGLGGCAAIAGLDGITEQACAPNCDGGAATADGTVTPGADGPSLGNDVAVSDDSTTGQDTTTTSDDTGTGVDTGAGDDAQSGTDAAGSDGGDAGSDTGTSDAGEDTGTVDAGHDAGPDAADAGCGPLNTTANCTACGLACVANNATSPACNGTTCSYACSANFLDCNKGTAPDPDGCECNSPGATQAQCCAGTCPIAHDYNLDLAPAVGRFYDCVAAGTYNGTVAMDACIAFTGNASLCTSGYYCPQFPDGGGTNLGDQVCSDKASTCSCWAYDGSLVGLVSVGTTTTCYCPQTSGPHWN